MATSARSSAAPVQLLEPGHVPPHGRPVRQLGQRRPTPEVDRGRERRGARGHLALGHALTTLPDQTLEAARVDVIRRDPQPVPARAGLDDLGTDHPAEA
jgi:hypothetical protein